MLKSRLQIREVSPGSLTPLLALSGILAASFVIPPFHREAFSVCIIKTLLGIPCPGCGMTRAFLYIGHLDFRSAWELNISSLPAYGIVVLLWLQSMIRAIAGHDIRIQFTPRERAWVMMLGAVAVASSWTYNIVQNPWV